jgi:quercetin dioxygenase-like cupin family protein/heme-degrading monooxygenase HmoA
MSVTGEPEADPRPFPARVLRPEEIPSVDRGNGARTIPLVTSRYGATAFLNGITVFEPGAAIGHHTHNCVESVMVIEGTAVVDIDDVETRLRRFDTTFVPANVPHHFRNASAEHPMRIFWTYGSTDATRTPTATGIEARIDAEQRKGPSGDEPVAREAVDLDVLCGHESAFEEAVAKAGALFQRSVGCRGMELVKSVEDPLRYRLLVTWTALTDHTREFRSSDEFRQWRALVVPHLRRPPDAGHFTHVLKPF